MIENHWLEIDDEMLKCAQCQERVEQEDEVILKTTRNPVTSEVEVEYLIHVKCAPYFFKTEES